MSLKFCYVVLKPLSSYPQNLCTGVEELHACNSQQYRSRKVTANKASQVGSPVHTAQDEAEDEVKANDYVNVAYALADHFTHRDKGTE